MPSTNHPPLFCHVHIPKTGGTTINAMLSKWFPSAFEVIHHPSPKFVLSIEDLEKHLSRNPTLQCIATHHLRAFPSVIQHRRVHYFTMLREPLDRTISTIIFMKRSFGDLSSEHRASVPSHFCQMVELEILKLWTADFSDRTTLPGNPVTAQFIDNCNPWEFSNNRRACEAAAAAKCIAILNRFLHVGDFAHFEDSVRDLARRIRDLGVSACEMEQIPSERTSRNLRGDLKWLQDGRIVDAYMDGMMIDGMVYRHFAYRNAHGRP
jgi:hypothetical protein